MASYTISKSAIMVHGRGSIDMPFTIQDNGAETDISDWPLYFEVDGASIRKRLVADPANPKGQRIVLENALIAQLSKKALLFVVRDERRVDDDLPDVLWSGTIAREGFVGLPDDIID